MMNFRRRGSTLVEFGIVAVLSMLLLGAVFIWMQTITMASRSGLEAATAQGSHAYLEAVLSDDLDNVAPCLRSGFGEAFDQITTTGVTLYRDVDGDRITDRVTWVFADTGVTRSVLLGDGTTCPRTGTASAVPVTGPLFSTDALAAMSGGVQVGPFADCWANTCSGVDALSVSGRISSGGSGTATVPFEFMVPFSVHGSKT